MPSLKSLTTTVTVSHPHSPVVNIVAALVVGANGAEVGEGAGEGVGACLDRKFNVAEVFKVCCYRKTRARAAPGVTEAKIKV